MFGKNKREIDISNKFIGNRKTARNFTRMTLDYRGTTGYNKKKSQGGKSYFSYCWRRISGVQV